MNKFKCFIKNQYTVELAPHLSLVFLVLMQVKLGIPWHLCNLPHNISASFDACYIDSKWPLQVAPGHLVVQSIIQRIVELTNIILKNNSFCKIQFALKTCMASQETPVQSKSVKRQKMNCLKQILAIAFPMISRPIEMP